jgi:uncharacterized protein
MHEPARRERLDDILGRLERLVIAYSGGVDSAYLTSRAHAVLGRDAVAVTAVSPSLARRERSAAAQLARRFGWNHLEVDTHELQRAEYTRNAADRCFWCKTELFDVIEPIARDRDARIAVGTNLDDLGDHRPGLGAARERGALAPLVEAGLDKAAVRELSRRAGLPTSEKPASPCLASRLAYGVEVTPERLERVDAAEEIVRGLGFEVLRVRDHGDLARIEVPEEEIERVVSHRERLAAELAALGFRYVTVDLAGFRSGSLNEVLVEPTFRPR